jgi:uncharacterized protein (TIGR02271 family)
MNVARTIFAIFDDFLTAQRVASALEREGFDLNAISVLAPNLLSRKLDAAGQPERPPSSGTGDLKEIAIPGLGGVAAAGALAESLGQSSTATGGLIPALTRLGFSEPAARHYFECLRRRQVLLTLDAPETRTRGAVEVMRRFGARAVEEIDTGAPPPNGKPPLAPRETAPRETAARENLRDQVTVPVVEEQLDVQKRQVSRGGIRVNSQIVEQPIQESIRLREEHVSVERRPVDREATEADLAAFKEGSIEIHETIEEPVISKRRRVVEEVIIGRETRERTQSISETVRKTQVNVEQLTPSRASAKPAPEDDPAYLYGADLARDERYRHAEWSEIEPHARRQWEARNGGTWEQFKDAVRTAWDKVSGR